MSEFKKISAGELTSNPYKQIGDNWMLITAQKDGKVNTMTASWGAVGVMWGSPSAFIFVRESRYTKEFIDSANSFSLSFLDCSKYRNEQKYLGTVSGRDEDKIEKTGLTVAYENGVPYFTEADEVIICTSKAKYPLTQEGIFDEEIIKRSYASGDYHTMYIGKIDTILVKEQK